ncbi:MAG: nucleotidyltransferase domain-containing protein [Cyanobacteria bacterium P01_D01_bin.44]
MSPSNTPYPSSEQMAQYRASARRRAEQRLQQQLTRCQRGREVANVAAHLLKDTWSANKVVLFGSMLTSEKVHGRSDIDLAVWGLPAADYLKALAALLDIDPDFSIDLIEAEHASQRWLEVIKQGIEV